MKKLLNPKLNTIEVTMINTSSSDEKIEASKSDFKGKKVLKSVEESCYRGFHHTRWITHCMAFPCPATDSLFPMDHLLPFDVSLTIPKNIRKMIYAAFSPITAYIHGYSLYSHVHRDVYIIQNCWSVPWIGSDSYDSWPSICLEIARIQPFSIHLKSYIRNPLRHWKHKRELRVSKL